MAQWTKKEITREEVKSIHDLFGCDPLTSSILARRGIKGGKDIQFFLEDDKRFLHNPFLFSAMEDAVDRILQAQEEGEKVLIFGDRDVDGITSTTVLYDELSSMGIDVSWRLPGGTDAYGLNKDAVNSFAKDFGSLIITVDCGISNNEEIALAASLGIDVIVLDHHNPPEKLPSPAIIVDPKCTDSGYPFKEISGCAVAYKTVSALRFAKSGLYKQEICLLAAVKSEDGTSVNIQALKTENLTVKSRFSKVVEAGSSISDTKLADFLSGQQIFAWDKTETEKNLALAFGSGVEFNLLDTKSLASKLMPSCEKLSLSQIMQHSKILRYSEKETEEIDGFFNIFVTYVSKEIYSRFPALAAKEDSDLQLVAIAALADIMPLLDENRIFVKQGLEAMNSGKTRPGLVELLSKVNLLGRRISCTDLGWQVIPVLNAAGRLGNPEKSMELFLEKTPAGRDRIADEILSMNDRRKEFGSEAWEYAKEQAAQSVHDHAEKICLVIDRRINRGVSGILAARLMQTFKIPSFAVTIVDGVAVGSGRSCRGFSLTDFLDKFGPIFLNHGGHDFAAGFSFEESRLEDFKAKMKELAPTIELGEDEGENLTVDAELPESYLTPEILNIVDSFEPYGKEFPELTFESKGLQIVDALVMGKTERQHLKLTLNAGKSKWPAIFWGEAERLHRDFDIGDKVDILYHLGRNRFNGVETPQMILSDIRLSQ